MPVPQLQDYVREMRGSVKAHEPSAQGHIARLHSDGYGFIETPEGGEVYCHRNSVVDGDFDRLRIGGEVRCREGLDEEGPVASTLHLAGVPFTLKKKPRRR